MLNGKSALSKIVLHRAEGGRLENAQSKTFTEANRILGQWSCDAPKGGGYDKVDVLFEWENGQSLRHRVDLQHSSCGPAIDLVLDIEHYVKTWQGRDLAHSQNPKKAAALMDLYRRQGLDKLAQSLEANCELSDMAQACTPHDSEAILSHRAVSDILSGQRESCSTERIGYYESLDALVDKVSGTKNWRYGEVFVYAEAPEKFVIMKQIAMDSCEMLTVTNAGFQDVITAYRYPKIELTQTLNDFMEPRSTPRQVAGQV